MRRLSVLAQKSGALRPCLIDPHVERLAVDSIMYVSLQESCMGIPERTLLLILSIYLAYHDF